MQCVEQGKLDLDADVTSVLPELRNIEVLTGFEESSGKPILKKATNKITLKLLLTHSSGMGYDIFNPTLMKWRAYHGQEPGKGGTMSELFGCPLLYEPGTAWEYSPAIDWVGLMVERVNGNVKLGSYLERSIWKPLGATDFTFHLEQREDLRNRMPDMSLRDPSGSGKAIYTDMKAMRDPVKDDFGGGGIYGCAPEYMKILTGVLKNDSKLLRKDTFDEMFKPQLTEMSRNDMMKKLEDPNVNLMLGGSPLGAKKDWGLGGMLYMEDHPGWRRKDSMTWGGMPNLTWVSQLCHDLVIFAADKLRQFIDRETGLCGIYASQILPPGDAKSMELSQMFEKTMYDRYTKVRARM